MYYTYSLLIWYEIIWINVEIKGQFCYLETSSSCQIAENPWYEL
jgi:hypothetical protein